jgi:hypothetical protein
MRQRLMQVLGSSDGDEAMDFVERRFWTRAKPLPARVVPPAQAQVVDLAAWVRDRSGSRTRT